MSIVDMDQVLSEERLFNRPLPEDGKRKYIVIMVDYNGNGTGDIKNYIFSFFGTGVKPAGEVDCRGPSGQDLKNRIRMRFEVVPGDTIDDVVFANAPTALGVDFLIGKVGSLPCEIKTESLEFDQIEVKKNNTKIKVRNLKANSSLDLGYKFSVMVTHLVTGETTIVPCDPRIINK